MAELTALLEILLTRLKTVHLLRGRVFQRKHTTRHQEEKDKITTKLGGGCTERHFIYT